MRISPSENWSEYVGIYKAPENVTSVKPMLVFAPPKNSSEASRVFVDDISCCLSGLPGSKVFGSKLKHSGEAQMHDGKIVVDGNIEEFSMSSKPLLLDGRMVKTLPGHRVEEVKEWQGSKDLSGKIFLRWDNDFLYIAAEIEDDSHVLNNLPNILERETRGYMFDSLQFSIDPDNSGKEGNFIQFTLSQTPDGPALYREHTILTPEMPVGVADLGILKNAKTAIRREGNKTFYELAIPLLEIYPLSIEKGKKIGFSILANDNDGSGRKGYIEWSSGIGAGRNPAKYGQIICK